MANYLLGKCHFGWVDSLFIFTCLSELRSNLFNQVYLSLFSKKEYKCSQLKWPMFQSAQMKLCFSLCLFTSVDCLQSGTFKCVDDGDILWRYWIQFLWYFKKKLHFDLSKLKNNLTFKREISACSSMNVEVVEQARSFSYFTFLFQFKCLFIVQL